MAKPGFLIKKKIREFTVFLSTQQWKNEQGIAYMLQKT